MNRIELINTEDYRYSRILLEQMDVAESRRLKAKADDDAVEVQIHDRVIFVLDYLIYMMARKTPIAMLKKALEQLLNGELNEAEYEKKRLEVFNLLDYKKIQDSK
jgi:hypothetical protein